GWHSITAQARAAPKGLGGPSVQTAEDTVLPLEGLRFTGKKWQDVRTALNKAAKDGITAQWHTWPQAPPDLAAQIRRISAAWMAGKGLPEMGFTLGGLDELNDPDIRCLIAVGADGKVHGITSWMPVYASGRPPRRRVRRPPRLRPHPPRPAAFRGRDGTPPPPRRAPLPRRGPPLHHPARRAAGPPRPRRAAVGAAAPARHHRHHHGTGLRL